MPNQLVSCWIDSLAVATDCVEDPLGGPHVAAWVLVPGFDPLADVRVQRADGAVRFRWPLLLTSSSPVL